MYVSTHSRLKAAGLFQGRNAPVRERFNTQPPEGGWRPELATIQKGNSFNTQPPEGGWARAVKCALARIGFNTQPPEGGWAHGEAHGFDHRAFQHTAA